MWCSLNKRILAAECFFSAFGLKILIFVMSSPLWFIYLVGFMMSVWLVYFVDECIVSLLCCFHDEQFVVVISLFVTFVSSSLYDYFIQIFLIRVL